MEITCQSCSTAFIIDISVAPEEVVEVVCPGCFQLHKVRVPSLPGRKHDEPHHSTMTVSPESVAERLREGFTLFFEVRHPNRPDTHRLNPFMIKEQIYSGALDGTEEFRENQGRWFPIGEHPEFGRLFQILGRTVTTQSEEGDANAKRFAGWKGVPDQTKASSPLEPVPPSPAASSAVEAPLQSAKTEAHPAAPSLPSKALPPIEPSAPLPASRTGLWIALAVIAVLAAVVGWWFTR